MKISIQHGKLIDSSNDLNRVQDLHVADGVILTIGEKPRDFTPDKTVDATDCLVIPGLIDLQARLREPGLEHKGTIESETRAAAANGITTLCCPPDTLPIIDTPAIAEMIQHQAQKHGYAQVLPVGALTQQLKGEKLTEMQALKTAHCCALSNALRPISNIQTQLQALQYAATFGIKVFLHPSEPDLALNGMAHQGPVSTRLGLKGIPVCAETIAIAQTLELIEETGAEVHFGQISSARGVEMITEAKKRGLPVTVDIAMHQLFLIDTDLLEFNSHFHVLPPLRTQNDRNALRTAVKQGLIDAICSDHQPHEADAKQAPLGETEPGISALDTLLPLALRLASEEDWSLEKLVPLLTSGPANVLNRPAGQLKTGEKANITVVDPRHVWNLTPDTMASAGKNSPFIGWEFTGKVTHTLFSGETVYEARS